MGITVRISTANDFTESTEILLTSIVTYGMFGNFGNIIAI